MSISIARRHDVHIYLIKHLKFLEPYCESNSKEIWGKKINVFFIYFISYFFAFTLKILFLKKKLNKIRWRNIPICIRKRVYYVISFVSFIIWFFFISPWFSWWLVKDLFQCVPLYVCLRWLFDGICGRCIMFLSQYCNCNVWWCLWAYNQIICIFFCILLKN